MVNSKEVIIIGGGVSGLGMAVQLKRLLGHDNFTLYEQSSNIGGTWWHNRYPACACDIPSHFYSYSFDLNPSWTSMYPGRDELHRYFYSVAEKFDILPHCRFDSKCTGLRWDALRSVWVCSFVNTVTGETFVREAAAVVSAVGTLDRPFVPEIEGAETFEGQTFHSARWDDKLETKGKNIVVLGNGASATQFVPELVKDVAPHGKVTQLVRSAHWWTKRGNPTYSESFKLAMRYVPLAARMYRVFIAWDLDRVYYSFLMTKDGAKKRQKIRDNTNAYIDNDAPPKYRDILRPDYEPGCKRRVNTQTYLAALHSPNMHLAKDRVVKIGPRHVETEAGNKYPADAIIYATGFLTQEWLHPIKVEGEGGQDLHQAWKVAGGAEAYKGTVVAGFPNFFILYGPNAATGQHSVIFHSECQINFACRLMRPVLTGSAPARSIMVKPEAQRRDLSWVHKRLRNLVFNSGCQSWWMDPKTKKNTFIYPDPMFLYWLRTIFPTWSDFEIRRPRYYRRKSTFTMLLSSVLGVGAAAVLGLVSAGGVEKTLEAAMAWRKAIMS